MAIVAQAAMFLWQAFHCVLAEAVGTPLALPCRPPCFEHFTFTLMLPSMRVYSGSLVQMDSRQEQKGGS
jgi:hypothetical protein